MIKTSNEMVIGVYHSKDLDGVCSGAIIKLKYPNAILVPYDYGENLLPHVQEGVPIIMADVSVPRDIMSALASLSNNRFTWIDHHKSAIHDFSENPVHGVDCVLKVGISACELTWMHLFPDVAMPLPVILLGIYDTWRKDDKQWSWDKLVMPFQYGMRSIVGLDVNKIANFLTEKPTLEATLEIDSVATTGRQILDYQKQQNEISALAGSFTRLIGDKVAICMNSTTANSQLFEAVYNPEKHDIMLVFRYDATHWKVSLYTTHDSIDVSQIAKQFGGGGHAKAAGFQVKDINEVIPEL